MEQKQPTTANSSIGGEQIQKSPISSKGTIVTSITASAEKPDTTSSRWRIAQKFCLIWLDANIDESDSEYRNSITHLRRVVNTIDTFTDADQCVDFLTEIKDEKAFLIVSGDLGQHIIALIHDVAQLNAIYVLCENKFAHEQWVKGQPKVKGVFTQIESICESLKQATRQCYQKDSISVSFILVNDAENVHLKEFDQSFMYTLVLKEILLEIDYNDQSIKDLATYYRDQYADTDPELNIVAKFEQEYHLHLPIWWYTSSCFIYSMANRALRIQNVDTIIKVGLVICDLHRNIKRVHSEQSSDHQKQPLTVYRGQGLSKTDFDKLMQTKGGLISINYFLPTSKDRDVASIFADSNQSDSQLIGILFEMTIDTSISSAPFANLDNISCFPSENEILFSMHTVFRIGEIKQIGDNNRLWQVKLTLTSDTDQQLTALTKRLRRETQGGLTPWYRLVKLLILLGEFQKAQQLCQVLLDQASIEAVTYSIYHLLGYIKDELGAYAEALFFYEISVEFFEKILLPTHPSLITSYHNIGLLYIRMHEHSKALSFCTKTLHILEKTLPPNHPNLAYSYNNIGLLYSDMRDYSKALSSYDKAVEICQSSLPPNHSSFATFHNNIGGVCNEMGEYSKALSSHQKALEIHRKVLPPNHPDLAKDYNNIGWTYKNMGDYSTAIPFYERAVEIGKQLLPEIILVF